MILYANRYGEVVPLGPNYLPSYAAGVRCGIKELGPKLLGMAIRVVEFSNGGYKIREVFP